MARFLRDEQVSNLTIDPEAVSSLVDVFMSRGTSMPEFVLQQESQPTNVFLSFTIRFDEKGYRVFDKDQLLHYFQEATEVERILFELTSGESISTNRAVGSYLDLRLDSSENVTCFLTVSSDNEDWVNGSFAAVKEELVKYGNRHSWVKNPWVDLLIQMTGLFLGFFVSLWGASQIAPKLTIENAFLISFLVVLLVFSNLWTPINQKLRGIVYRAFPTIRFYRPKKDGLHWLYQALVGGIVVAASLYLLSWAFTYVGEILGAFIESDA